MRSSPAREFSGGGTPCATSRTTLEVVREAEWQDRFSARVLSDGDLPVETSRTPLRLGRDASEWDRLSVRVLSDENFSSATSRTLFKILKAREKRRKTSYNLKNYRKYLKNLTFLFAHKNLSYFFNFKTTRKIRPSNAIFSSGQEYQKRKREYIVPQSGGVELSVGTVARLSRPGENGGRSGTIPAALNWIIERRQQDQTAGRGECD